MRAIICFAVLLATAGAAAQLPRSGETIEVSIVNLDVVVTDRNGNRVTGLTAGDFEIREGGRVHPITHFAEYRSATPAAEAPPPAPAAPPPAPAAAPRAPRTVALFLEPVRLRRVEAKEMFGAMRALLRETIGPDDRATIVTWDERRARSVVRQPLTNDLAALEAALSAVELEHATGRPPALGNPAREWIEAEIEAERREETGADWIEGAASADGVMGALTELRSIQRKATALRALMSSLAPVEGRKILVLSMHRFGVLAGAGAFPRAKVDGDYESKFRLDDLHEELVRTANANSIALYPVYPGKVDESIISARSSEAQSSNLLGAHAPAVSTLLNEIVAYQNLAVQTGGMATWSPELIADMLPRVAEDLQSYYSLAFRPPAGRKDTGRRVTVRTKDPRYTVRTRMHFVEKSEATVMNERLIANLHEHFEAAAIPLSVRFGAAAAKGKKRWQVPLEIRFPIGALSILREGRNGVASFSVYVMVDTMSGSNEAHQQTQSLRIPHSELDAAKSSLATCDFVLEVDEKAKFVSVGVVDETAKTLGLKRVSLPPRGPR